MDQAQPVQTEAKDVHASSTKSFSVGSAEVLSHQHACQFDVVDSFGNCSAAPPKQSSSEQGSNPTQASKQALDHPSEAGGTDSGKQASHHPSEVGGSNLQPHLCNSDHKVGFNLQDNRETPHVAKPNDKPVQDKIFPELSEHLKRKSPSSDPCFSIKKSTKANKDGPIVIELFAGSGRVTAALKALGVRSAFGVDHRKISAVAPIMVADLTTRAGQALFMTWLEAPNLAGIFAAPPCGTCSLARNIKVRNSKGHVMSGPVPVRSVNFPEGFPNLKGTNLKRVLSANKLYAFLAKVMLIAHERGLILVIENQRSSLFWVTKYFQKIKHLFFFVAHQACAYGSSRPKWTALAVNRSEFASINETSPGESDQHVHKPWGVNADGTFATAEETAYPLKLARTIATCFVDAMTADGWALPEPSWTDDAADPSFAAMRAVSGRQPKASKVPPLVPEFKSVITSYGPISLLNHLPCPVMCRIKESWLQPSNYSNYTQTIPPHSQLLRV